MEAFQQALWGDDEERAWSVATYLMDTAEQAISGLARALAFGGLRDRGFESDAESRLRSLLYDAQTRDQSLQALRAAWGSRRCGQEMYG